MTIYIVLAENTDSPFSTIVGVYRTYDLALNAIWVYPQSHNKPYLLELDSHNFEIHYDLFDDNVDWTKRVRIVETEVL